MKTAGPAATVHPCDSMRSGSPPGGPRSNPQSSPEIPRAHPLPSPRRHIAPSPDDASCPSPGLSSTFPGSPHAGSHPMVANTEPQNDTTGSSERAASNRKFPQPSPPRCSRASSCSSRQTQTAAPHRRGRQCWMARSCIGPAYGCCRGHEPAPHTSRRRGCPPYSAHSSSCKGHRKSRVSKPASGIPG